MSRRLQEPLHGYRQVHARDGDDEPAYRVLPLYRIWPVPARRSFRPIADIRRSLKDAASRALSGISLRRILHAYLMCAALEPVTHKRSRSFDQGAGAQRIEDDRDVDRFATRLAQVFTCSCFHHGSAIPSVTSGRDRESIENRKLASASLR